MYSLAQFYLSEIILSKRMTATWSVLVRSLVLAAESPQWRRGPQTKPMLCNACGTRFRRTNQLNPAAALSPAGRAAAAAAAAAAAPSRRNLANKRDPPYVTSTSSKRSRSSSCY